MPRLKQSKRQQQDNAFRAALEEGLARQGIQDRGDAVRNMGQILNLTEKTVRARKKSPGGIPLRELRQLAEYYKWRPEQVIEIVLGGKQ